MFLRFFNASDLKPRRVISHRYGEGFRVKIGFGVQGLRGLGFMVYVLGFDVCGKG